MVKPVVMTIVLAALAGGNAGPGAQLPPLKAVMQEKADNAERLLRPLVLGDVIGIERYAQRLGRVTYTEVASWQSRPEPAYVEQAHAYVEAVQDLLEASEARNVRQASAAYSRLIASCVNCHQLVRAARGVSAPVLASPVVVTLLQEEEERP
jgi:hypothetical protein